MRGFLLFFLILTVLPCPAQDFLQLQYDVSKGLADNRVLSVLQDSRGFMWFGTAEGLSRFDGINYKNYFSGHDSSFLALNSIALLAETKPGHLLLETGCHFMFMNTCTGQFYKPPDFTNRSVCGITKISGNRFLVASPDTCFVTDQDMKIVDTLVPVASARYRTLYGSALDSGKYLLGVWGLPEYYTYDSTRRKFSRFDLGTDKTESGNLEFEFYDAAHRWIYFINYFSGIYRYSVQGDRLKKWPLSGYGGLIKISDSTVWVGHTVEARGAMLWNLRDDKMTPFKINGKTAFDAYTFYTDREGNHWMGTNEGVTKLTQNNQLIKNWEHFEGQPGGFPHPLSMVKGKDGQLYLTFFTAPILYRLDQRDDSWKLISKDLVTGPWCVNTVGDDIIFGGGRTTRFTTYSPLTGKFRHSSDFLRKYFPNSDILILAFQHSNGDRWYSGNKGGGFVRVDAKDGTQHHYTKDGVRGHFSWSYYVNHLEDQSGDIWFGVNKTPVLLHWDKQKDWFGEVRLDTVPGMEGVGLRGINTIVRDNKDNLWIGFEGTGIVKYDHARNRAVHYGIKEGLPSDFVSSMVFDGKGHLWIGTRKGLSCLSVDENKLRTFTKMDGLGDDNFTDGFIYYDSVSNKLWLGNTSGITRFDVDAMLTATRHEIKIYMDQIYINGKLQMDENVSLNLHPNQNNIQFRFVAVNMSGKPIQFSYRLEGHEPDWVDNLSSTTASYASLEPGTYHFVVRANYQGDTDEFFFSQPFTLVVATPWFRTWWFRLVVVVGSTFFIALLIRSYYARKNEKQNLVLEKQQAVEKERTRIATDMHDDFGASLSRIKFISEKIKLKAEGGPQLIHDLTKISDYSDQMTDKMSEIVWALNERYDSLDDLVSFSRAYAADYLQHHSIKFVFVSNTNTNQNVKGEVRRNVFLVIKESLHNIVKHAGATEVEINFQHKDHLKVIVHDNGKGFDVNNIRPFANGVNNMKSRMDNIGGNLEIINEHGTTIIITVGI